MADKKVKINSNIPDLGLGTLGDGMDAATEIAIRKGYRYIDCAAIYGNEHKIGEVFNKLFNKEKVVERKDVFISSKLWSTEWGNVKGACKQTLKDLQLDYLDLYLVHLPIAFKKTYPEDKPSGDGASPKVDGILEEGTVTAQEVWREMEHLVEAGLVKSIGISNFPAVMVHELLLNARIKPADHQIECHPYFQNKSIIAYSLRRGIHVTAYSPLGGAKSFEEPELKKIAAAHKKTPAQVVLKWILQQNVAVIPKSSKEERIVSNMQIFDFELTADEMKAIDALG